MGHIIQRREVLAPQTYLLTVKAEEIADQAKAGQFVILRVDEKGERIPLTIANFDTEMGTIEIVFQEVGTSTSKLARLDKGDTILNLIGPLGNPTEIRNYGCVVCLGGGVGVACLYPLTKSLKDGGNHVISIIGAKSKDHLIFEDRIRETSHELHVTTDDGSYGTKGFVTDALKGLLESERKIDRVFAIGPTIMMKVVAETTRPYSIKTIVSLNSLMMDGTGMCGACRVRVDGERKLTCIDGPEFDAHEVDFDLLLSRLNMYRKEEEISYSLLKEKQKHLQTSD
jgi:ferredoxin--NADP+ reductase